MAALKFFELLGLTPDIAACGNRPEKTTRLSLLEMEKQIGTGKKEFKVAQLILTVPDFKQLTFGWKVYTSINTHQSKTLLFCFDNDITSSPDEIIRELIGCVTDKCGKVYGISYERSFVKGPDLYAYGISAGLGYSDDDMSEADRIGSWMNERISQNRHLDGLFRDVYESNILSENHMQSLVDGMSFFKWVEEAKAGSIQPLSRDVYRWDISKSDVEKARKKMLQNNLLISS